MSLLLLTWGLKEARLDSKRRSSCSAWVAPRAAGAANVPAGMQGHRRGMKRGRCGGLAFGGFVRQCKGPPIPQPSTLRAHCDHGTKFASPALRSEAHAGIRVHALVQARASADSRFSGCADCGQLPHHSHACLPPTPAQLDTAPHHATCLLCRWAAGASTRHCPTPCHLFALQMGCRCQHSTLPHTMPLVCSADGLQVPEGPLHAVLTVHPAAACTKSSPLLATPAACNQCILASNLPPSHRHVKMLCVADHWSELTTHNKCCAWPTIDQHTPLQTIHMADDRSAHTTAHQNAARSQ